MARWLTYVKERFPIATYLLLIGGFTFSGLFLAGGGFQWKGFVVSFVGFLLFFFQLRLMDELKDYDKDVVAHPDRPLPRGLLTTVEVGRTIKALSVAMTGYALLTAIFVNWTTGLSYLTITVYLLLMYREFFAGAWLDERPLLYAVSHQFIVFGVCIFAVAVSREGLALQGPTMCLGLVVLGSFFGYEVCRKLDPGAHPLLKTYLSVYGPAKTSIIVLVATAIAGAGAAGLGLGALLWPAEALVVVSLVVLFTKPDKYKVVEAVATLSLTVHLWAVVIRHLAGWP